MTPVLRLRAWCLVIAVAVILFASTRTNSQGTGFSIVNVSVVDVVSGQVLSPRTRTVIGDRISAISEASPARGATVVDGTGKFLIPGLWDMHAHIQGNENAWLPLYIANGVTGIRDMGADLDFILPIREATSSGRRSMTRS